MLFCQDYCDRYASSVYRVVKEQVAMRSLEGEGVGEREARKRERERGRRRES